MQGKTLRHSSELTLLAAIKGGEVPISSTTSYATRLRILLDALFRGRKRDTERDIWRSFKSVVDKVEVIQFVRWTLLEQDTKLLLAVAYDGTWDAYIRRIESGAHGLLDLIFSHCEGYEQRFATGGYRGFTEWVKPRQVDSSFWYSNRADLTLKDTQYLSELRRHVAAGSSPADISELSLEDPQSFVSQPATDGLTREGQFLLKKVRQLFPNVPIPGTGAPEKTHEGLYDAMLRELEPVAPGATSAQRPDEGRKVDLSAELGNIQGNIITPYRAITHGCQLFLRVTDAHKAREFLARLLDKRSKLRVTTEAESDKSHGEVGHAINVLLTKRGLEMFDVPLTEFPEDFRDGMQERSPSFGDLGHNHPDRWRPPAPLEVIDVVLTFQTENPGAEFVDDHTDKWLKNGRHSLHPLYDELEKRTAGFQLLATQPLKRTFFYDDGRPIPHAKVKTRGKERAIREHFGYHDGVSQPVADVGGVKEVDATRQPELDRRPVGEFLLGYDAATKASDLLRNGSFVAMRKLRQDVAAFEDYVATNSRGQNTTPGTLRAKLMGRYDDGRPVGAVVPPDQDTARFNDFDYESPGEKRGHGCPFQAHARLANPRQGHSTPRILRRGFSYGPRFTPGTASESRGLLFVAYNASLSQQFELIQSWLAGGNITGVMSSMNDPFLGVRDTNTARPPFSFTYRQPGAEPHTPDVHHLQASEKPLVTLEWGLYLFAPSIPALTHISRPAQAGTSPTPGSPATPSTASGAATAPALIDVSPGQWMSAARDPKELLATMQRASRESIRLLLEDSTLRATLGPTVWSAVLAAADGAHPTAYGVLVGGSCPVRGVLADSTTYSVSAYDDRLQRGLGRFYLGLDSHTPLYQAESKFPNDYMRSLDAKAAFWGAHADTTKILTMLGSSGGSVPLTELGATLVALRCRDWFGAPDGKHLAIFPPLFQELAPALVGFRDGGLDNFYERFRNVSLEAFFPSPSPVTSAVGAASGKQLNEAFLRLVQDRWASVSPNQASGTLLERMIGQVRAGSLLPPGSTPAEQEAYVTRMVAGSVSATVVATVGSFISSVAQLILSERFARLQEDYLLALTNSAFDRSSLLDPSGWLMRNLLGLLANRPVPELLHRRTSGKCPVHGTKLEVEKDTTLAVSLFSAAQDEIRAQTYDGNILFGGSVADGQLHACPGQYAALGTLAGALAALFEQKSLSAHAKNRLALDFRPRG